MEWFIVVVVLALAAIIVFTAISQRALFRRMNLFESSIPLSIEDKPPRVIEKHIPAPINVAGIEKAIQEIPNKVLSSITSSTNNIKGNLGELIAYLQLKGEYDRLIPLGDIVDFIGIKFQKDNEPGRVDFIDIKTGDSAKLSKGQQKLRDLIEKQKVNFLKIKVATDARKETSSEDAFSQGEDPKI